MLTNTYKFLKTLLQLTSENSTHRLHMHTFTITPPPLSAEGVTSVPWECWFLSCGRWWGCSFVCARAASYSPVTHMPHATCLCHPSSATHPCHAGHCAAGALHCQPSNWGAALFILLMDFFSSWLPCFSKILS